ncbi:MAG: PEGA domain-containing protein [Sandaracinaceae bacterium]|nr:PEGA domain-containing protein [Sandaracinaceae bacterium]
MSLTSRTLLLALALVALPASALAQGGSDTLIDQGIALREQGRDAEALAMFEDAHRLHPSMRALTQIGLAEQALRRYLPACRHLSEALASNDPWVQERRSVLEGALSSAAQHVARVTVEGQPAGAEVTVNGTSIGTIPTPPLWVEPSTLTIEVHAQGYLPTREQVSVGAGQQLRHQVTLTARGASPVTGPGERPPGYEPTPSGSGGGSISPVGPILDGLGGAMLLTGLVTGLLTLDADSRLSAMCDGTRCYPEAESILGERRTLAITTDVMLFGGATIAIVGVLLTVLLDGS